MIIDELRLHFEKDKWVNGHPISFYRTGGSYQIHELNREWDNYQAGFWLKENIDKEILEDLINEAREAGDIK